VQGRMGRTAAIRSGLEFWQVAGSEFPDFVIEWKDASDGDASMVGDVIAHSDFPSGCGGEIKLGKAKPIHFDDSEHTWCKGAQPGKLDIQTCAIHEIGHLLGLGHGEVVGAIMTPGQPDNFIQHTLTQDDINALSITMPPIPSSGKLHYITPTHTTYKVLDVAGASQDNGAKVILWDPLRARNQSFRPEPGRGGAFRFVAEHSGKVLTVEGGSKDDGARLIQWDWQDEDNQLFYLENPRGAAQVYIFAKHSRKVLDVAGAGQGNGTPIHQWTSTEFPIRRNQVFSLL
jgi:Ricin-type beta-trefoil lectin domain-like/Matrixin